MGGRNRPAERFVINRDVNIGNLKGLVKLLDGYQVNYFQDPKSFDRIIREGKLGRDVQREWKKIRRELGIISDTLRFIPHLNLWASLETAFRFLSIIFMFAAVGLPIIRGSRDPLAVLPTAIYAGLFCLTLSAYFARKVADKIEGYFKEHKEKYKMKRRYLKQVVQKLLNTLSYHIKRQGLDPSKHKVDLFTADYEGITIIKKPRLFRKHHVAVVDIGQKRLEK